MNPARKKITMLHPLLFAVYPALSLYSANIDLYASADILFRPMLVALLLAAALWLIARIVLKDAGRAAVLASGILLTFFLYGHANNVLWEFSVSIGGFNIGRSKVLFALLGAVNLLLVWLVFRSRGEWQNANTILASMGAILVFLPVSNIALSKFSAGKTEAPVSLASQNLLASKQIDALPDRPHIYYIILDGYGRADVLDSLYQFDNTPFIGALQEKGFYVARDSRANYAQTMLSVASSLNSQYLNDVAAAVGSDSYDRTPLGKMMEDNAAAAVLKAQGYKFAFFRSGYGGVDIRSADEVWSGGSPLSEFETELLNSTPVMDLLFIGGWYDPWLIHRKRIEYTLENLHKPASSESPVFVFAHILAPHPPFVFGPNGEMINQREINSKRYFVFADGVNPEWGLDEQEYLTSYREQAAYLGEQVAAAVERILATSATPPVIVIQSDHGPSLYLDADLSNPNDRNLYERMPILNAYYFPEDRASDQLYASISPVNTFRLVFNVLFDADYPLLDDVSHFSTWYKPYTFRGVNHAGKLDPAPESLP